MKEYGVGLLGLGTVGSGTARILLDNAPVIEKRLGRRIALRKVVDLDIATDRGLDLPKETLSTRFEDILEDPEIKLVVELIGGIEPARTFIMKSIAAGKHVVTANKALLAKAWEEIFEAAADKGVEVYFEGSVGGGIPIIKALREGLAANRIQNIYGIINGTSNFILSRMTETGAGFTASLNEAKKEGYAEADPTLDVEGIDAAHKLCILATLAYGARVPFEAIYTEGITRITPLDIRYAGEFGYKIKLLALAKESDGKVEVRVHPTMIPSSQLLATVGGVYNAIYVRGDAVGSTLFYGRGAGSLPTGSAVVGDIMSIAARTRGETGLVRPRNVPFTVMEASRLKPIDDVVTSYYIRLMALDRPGVLSTVSGILGMHGISIASVIQKGREKAGPVPIVMRTHEAMERDVRRAMEEIAKLDVIPEKPLLIRVEENY